MKLNEEIIKKWEDIIKHYPKLKISDIKEKYKEYADEKRTIDEKEDIKNEMIEGTMYCVIGFIKSSLLSKLRTNVYDLDDVINSFVYEWGERITSPSILDYDSLSQIYSRQPFMNKLTEDLFGEDAYDPIIKNLNISSEVFVDAFYKYVRILQKNPGIISDEARLIHEIVLENDSILITDLKNVVTLFNSIIDSFNCDINEIELDKTNVFLFEHLLVTSGYEGYYNKKPDNIYYNDLTKTIEKNISNKQVIDFIMNNDHLSYNEKTILSLRFGLNGNPKYTQVEIGKKMGLSPSRVGQIGEKALRKLARSGEFHSIIGVNSYMEKELPESEYKQILELYGREVKDLVDKYYEEHHYYPQFSDIIDQVSMKQVFPYRVGITNKGDVLIQGAIIEGFKRNPNIHFSTTDDPEVLKDLSTPRFIIDVYYPEKEEPKYGDINAPKHEYFHLWTPLFEELYYYPEKYFNLSNEDKNNKKIIECLINNNNYDIFYKAENLDFLTDESLKTIFNVNVLDKIINNFGFETYLFKAFKKFMLDNGLITKNEYINTIISLVEKYHYAIDISQLDQDILFDENFIIHMYAIYDFARIGISPGKLMEKFGDNKNIIKVILKKYPDYVVMMSDSLKNDIAFLQEVIKSSPQLLYIIQRNRGDSLGLNLISSVAGGGGEFNDYALLTISRLGEEKLKDLYKMLCVLCNNNIYQINKFYTQISAYNPKIIEYSPEALENEFLKQCYETRKNAVNDLELSKRYPYFVMSANKNIEFKDIENKPYDQVLLLDLTDYESLHVLKEIKSRGYNTLQDLLNINRIMLSIKFANSVYFEQIYRLVVLLQCKFLNVYPIDADYFMKLDNMRDFYSGMLFSDSLIEKLLRDNTINTPQIFFEKIPFILNSKYIDLNVIEIKELLLKSKIFKDYIDKSRVEN